MALSDAQVSKQIEHMIAFIQNESQEKVEEIYAKVSPSPGPCYDRPVRGSLVMISYFRLTKNFKLRKVDWSISNESKSLISIQRKKNNWNNKNDFNNLSSSTRVDW